MRGFQEWYLDEGGKWGRRVSRGCYHVIEMIDCVSATGELWNGNKYHVELSEVDLFSITQKTIDSAIKSCGWEGINDLTGDQRERAVAEMLFDYGARASLHQCMGNSWHALVAEARKESYALTKDPRRHEELMNRPVNKIGSTAREMMQGDFNSAMERGVRTGDVGAKIMAKMHGIPAETIAAVEAAGPRHGSYSHNIRLGSAPVEDPLAYAMGFMDGEHAQALGHGNGRDDLAQAYIDGYKMGVAVRMGEAERPDWIQ
jgi:hypothetical protein